MVTIVSGGQTGVDRAALDAAIACGLPYRGWCPKGGWAEDKPAPPGVLALYPNLHETPEAAPEQRTAWNVRDADAILVLTGAGGLRCSKGTGLAVATADAAHKPCAVIDLDDPEAPAQTQAFLRAHDGQAVCIGGPRESETPGIYEKAKTLLLQALTSDRT